MSFITLLKGFLTSLPEIVKLLNGIHGEFIRLRISIEERKTNEVKEEVNRLIAELKTTEDRHEILRIVRDLNTATDKL